VREAAAKLDLSKVIASGAAPRVSITSPASGTSIRDDQANVEASLTDQGGGIGKVEWRVNGTTVGVDTPAAVTATAGRTAAISKTLALTPGDNRIEVVAYNGQELIASEPISVVIKSVQEAATGAPRLYVLAVGVNDYWDSALRLSFATPDAKALSDGLRKAGGKLYERVEVMTVLDADATAANLERTFGGLSGKVRAQDVFVFFMSGHGKTIDGRFYFIPQDFRYAGESSIVSRGIGQDRLQGWFARIAAQKSILLFDACESGSLIGERIALRGMEEKTAIDLLTRAMGRTVLTATTDDKPAAEGYRGHGVFTYTLLSALGEADKDGDGVVDVLELADYVDKQVPALTYDTWKMRQVPQMKIVGSNFPLVSKTALLPAVSDGPSATIPAKPTHVVIAPAQVRQSASDTAPVLIQLTAGTQVRLMESAGGWVLVARDGKKLGYVDAKAIVSLQ
jgi:Caspase domain/Bacterial Ig domain/Bacterial SH3 domain